jgi:phosphoribosylaminoimidazolecarboxamide formyltransferase/IMP cyclohydrolase
LIFASKVCKNTKSNTIVLQKRNTQSSELVKLQELMPYFKRLKKQNLGFDLNGAVMASDAFFPFPDCVIAKEAGITAVIQPGGSIKTN